MASHVLKITLAHIRPPISRRLRVPSTFTLADLHDVIQAAFDWEDQHLHDFRAGGKRYGVPDPEEPDALLDEQDVTIADVLPRKGSSLEYVYDYGDHWLHKVSVDAVDDDAAPRSSGRSFSRTSSASVACLAAKRATPPEDSGGPHGYAEFLAAIADPDHERHRELLDWIGGAFDPEQVSVGEISRRMSRFG